MSKIHITPVAESVPFDNSTNGFLSDNTQGAIEETSDTAGSSRYAVIFASSGNTSAKYLEIFPSVTSDTSPFVIAENSEITSLSISAKNSTTCTVEVYINGVSINSLSLTAQKTTSSPVAA